jgi:hypothetical protein
VFDIHGLLPLARASAAHPAWPGHGQPEGGSRTSAQGGPEALEGPDRDGPVRLKADTTYDGYCTFAVTEAVAASVNVQLFVLLPPLEHAPDQTTSRPFVALSTIVVPAANDADPELPTLTLIPDGFDITRSPLRPVAVTVRGTS